MVSSRMDPKIKALSTVGLFSACNKKELQSVARLCTPLSLEEGSVLTTEGSPGRECFVIIDGKASVTIGGKKVSEVCREMGVSAQAFYSWKRRYAGLGLNELRELRQLRDENRKLKTLVADLTLDKHILQEVLSKKACSLRRGGNW